MTELRTSTPQLLSECGLAIDLDIARFCAEPSRAEQRFLDRLTGPVLDVGCGPGRAAAYLRRRGKVSIGVDISASLVDLARHNGALAVRQNIFDLVPFEGRWQEVLLLDGNIGIGGAPAKMLERLRRIVVPGGRSFIEVTPDGPTRELVVREHLDGVVGEPFAWAVVSMDGIDELIADSGWTCHHVHTVRDRVARDRSVIQRAVDRLDRRSRLVVELERIA